MCVWLHRRTDRRCGPAACTCPRAAFVRARVCEGAIGLPCIRADTCEHFPSASTAGGSARRRSPGRRRSTQTSARGTPRRSPRCPGYAPPSPARAARHCGRDTLGGVVGAARAVVRGGDRRCALARVCAQTCGHAHARVCTCGVIAARTKDGVYVCMYVYVYVCIIHTHIYRYMCTCVRGGYGRACGCTASRAHMRAIARADDAAVAITCAHGYVRRHI
jgi:hypothetical protein